MPPRRPRLLYVITLAEVGGAQTYVRYLIDAMRAEFEVILAAHGDGPLRDHAAELGIMFVPLRHVRRPLSPVQDVLGVIELTSLFRRLRPDVVHLNSSKAGVLGRIAAALARVPVRIFTAHGWAFEAVGGFAPLAYRLADRAVRPLTSMVICVSESGREAGLAERTCAPERTTVIPTAVAVDDVPPRPPRPARPVEILSAGRLSEQKDFSTLIAAVARLPTGEARLRILGDGPLRDSLQAEIESLGVGDRVLLVGEVLDVPAFLAESDIFVLSSRWEGMPRSVLEAMTAGLPVVASDVGGLKEVVVDGETGYLTAPGSIDELEAALARLVADAELRERLGEKGRQRVEERFSLPSFWAAHLALYQRLLEVA